MITNKYITQQDQEAAAACGYCCKKSTHVGSVYFKGGVDFPRLVCLGQEGLSERSFTATTPGLSNLKDLWGP